VVQCESESEGSLAEVCAGPLLRKDAETEGGGSEREPIEKELGHRKKVSVAVMHAKVSG
jgi:hypothetical protein